MSQTADLVRLTDDPWVNLATAIALQAIQDAASGVTYLSAPARAWLASDGGIRFLELLNFDPQIVLDWLKKMDLLEAQIR
jgi:hypothetical protein